VANWGILPAGSSRVPERSTAAGNDRPHQPGAAAPPGDVLRRHLLRAGRPDPHNGQHRRFARWSRHVGRSGWVAAAGGARITDGLKPGPARGGGGCASDGLAAKRLRWRVWISIRRIGQQHLVRGRGPTRPRFAAHSSLHRRDLRARARHLETRDYCILPDLMGGGARRTRAGRRRRWRCRGRSAVSAGRARGQFSSRF